MGLFVISLGYEENEEVSAFICSVSQNASAGVSRMLLGNKCDIEAKRKVSKEIGEKVSAVIHTASMWVQVHARCFIGVRNSFPVRCFLQYVNPSLHTTCKISKFLYYIDVFFFRLKHA